MNMSMSSLLQPWEHDLSPGDLTDLRGHCEVVCGAGRE